MVFIIVMASRYATLLIILLFIIPLTSFGGDPDPNTLTNAHKKEQFSELPTTPNLFQPQELVPIGSQAALQGFYWLVPDNGEWWNMLKEKSPQLAASGFDAIWAPPPVKTDTGTFATGGYEPYDFYDLGEYNQKGRVRTRFGTRLQLEEFISTANSHGMGVIADVVINHRRGGEPEFNPFVNVITNTNFENIASGKLKMNYTHFWPNQYGERDRYQFANFPDISHDHPYVYNELIKWGRWLRDEIGFDGWRFDVAHGINETLQKDWMKEVGGFGVGEYWFGTFGDMLDYIDTTDEELRAFDFFLMYALRWMAISEGSYDLRNLRREGLLWNDRISNSMTFAVNHDTVRDENVNIDQNLDLVYSYILTHEGYPTVFWQNFFDPDLQPTLKALLSIRKNLVQGGTTILYSDSDLYMMQREGNPGILYLLNDNPVLNKSREITTQWRDTILQEQLVNGPDIITDSSGKTTVTVPPASFLIYAESDPFANITRAFDHTDPQKLSRIAQNTVVIDGEFDLTWGNPVIFDNRGDAANLQTDLYNGYMTYNDEYLNIGFSYGKKLIDKILEFGIALDTREGGAINIPGPNSNIKFQRGNNPDYLITMSSGRDDPWNEPSTATFYSFDEEWSDGKTLSETEFTSDTILGYTEIRIPLSMIEFDRNQISFKIYSSTADVTTATDTMPQDSSLVSGDGNSWLFMPAGITIDGESIKTEVVNGFLNFHHLVLLTSNLLLIALVMKRSVKLKR